MLLFAHIKVSWQCLYAVIEQGLHGLICIALTNSLLLVMM